MYLQNATKYVEPKEIEEHGGIRSEVFKIS